MLSIYQNSGRFILVSNLNIPLITYTCNNRCCYEGTKKKNGVTVTVLCGNSSVRAAAESFVCVSERFRAVKTIAETPAATAQLVAARLRLHPAPARALHHHRLPVHRCDAACRGARGVFNSLASHKAVAAGGIRGGGRQDAQHSTAQLAAGKMWWLMKREGTRGCGLGCCRLRRVVGEGEASTPAGGSLR